MGLMAGKTTIVTGGGTGIGFGIARRFLEEDAASVLIAGRRKDVLQDAVQRLKDLVPDAPVKYRICDITDEEQVEAAVEAACDGNGELDVMVCNAGTGFPSPILEADLNGWKSMCELNIIGTLACIKHAARKMKGKGGSIVNISSVEAGKCGKWMGSYSTSKAGMEMLTKCAALELAPFKIRVNAIRPGLIPTEVLQASMAPAWRERCVEHTPLGRPGTPEEIGDGVLYFASDMGKWTTGELLSICGGMGLPAGEHFDELAEMVYGEEMMKACRNE
jgi:NAD(P)-dependent dehydrogenase (short-subunit alcohol dehydrogenase family)